MTLTERLICASCREHEVWILVTFVRAQKRDLKANEKCDDFLRRDYWTSLLTKVLFFLHAALDESVKIVESMGGWCRGQIVDISRREEVYKAAAEIKNNFGDVS